METTRVACVSCGNKILPDTAARNNGLCGVCERKRAKLAAKAAMDNDILIIRYADEFSTLREMTRDVVRSAFLDLDRVLDGYCIFVLCIYF
jgi:hypothetical protein